MFATLHLETKHHAFTRLFMMLYIYISYMMFIPWKLFQFISPTIAYRFISMQDADRSWWNGRVDVEAGQQCWGSRPWSITLLTSIVSKYFKLVHNYHNLMWINRIKKIKGHLHTLAGFDMFGICTVISVNFMVKFWKANQFVSDNASQLDSQMSLFFRWAHQKVRGWDPWNVCLTGMPVCQTWSNRLNSFIRSQAERCWGGCERSRGASQAFGGLNVWAQSLTSWPLTEMFLVRLHSVYLCFTLGFLWRHVTSFKL